MTNIQAAVGCAQLERYEEFTKKKLDIHKFYSEELNPMNDVFMHEDVHSSRWISYFILQKNAPFNLNTLFLFAQKNGIQGRVFVQFIIEKDGNISGIRSRGPHGTLERAAESIIEKLPKMTPGYQMGLPVKVPFSIPITFRLQ